MFDVIVVGAGIFGLTVAQTRAERGEKVLVLEKRGHIGGNAYSEFDAETGIEVHKYGAHLFHTSDETVWNYVNRFSKFTGYVHRVWTTHQGQVYSMPINLSTINQFFGKALTPGEAKALVESQAEESRAVQEHREPKNLLEQGVKLIGQPLFDAFIRDYTQKQWQTPIEDLPPSIIQRLPVRFHYDNRYFNNTFEGLPADGYEALFKNMVTDPKIEVRLNVDFFDLRGELLEANPNAKVVYTGPIDAYFEYRYGELSWRSLDLEREVVDVEDFQGCPVMNYADLEQPYTRIHEFKHFHPERWGSPNFPGYDSGRTVIVKEYSKTWRHGDEPYYPVETAENLEKFKQYQQLAAKESVTFGGRLGEYKYYDMDKVFAKALEVAKEL
ncbi:MAG: UDP-galactopyranose mutase [Candidatus Ancillula sp.]|jgi:UDP-galactopyranose mutase|nr:UDP-galactopyranose mutase [Candidatus Ancillula sp.]